VGGSIAVRALLAFLGEKDQKEWPMREDFQPTVYIMANRKQGALYTGVTSNLMQRIHQHREGVLGGHSERVGAKMLVWFEQHATMETAIIREKRIKNWNRQWRINLIQSENRDWKDLAIDFGFPPIWTTKR
jgi:putative endonuclease